MKEYHLTWSEYNIITNELDGKYIIEGTGTFYYKNNLFHREDGPSKEYNSGVKVWKINGKYHRLDGPAIEYTDGTSDYYIYDKYFSSKEQFEKSEEYYICKNELEIYK